MKVYSLVHLAITAAVYVSGSGLLHAQSTRTADMISGNAATTGLAGQYHRRTPVSALDGIDAGASFTVTLDAIEAPGLTAADIDQNPQAGGKTKHLQSRGPLASVPGSLNITRTLSATAAGAFSTALLQAKNSGRLTGSLGSSQASPQQSTNPLRALSVGNPSKGGSLGGGRAKSNIGELGTSTQMDLGVFGATTAGFNSESVDGSADGGSSAAGENVDESGTVSKASTSGQSSSGRFESPRDPFEESATKGFEKLGGHLNFERPCGDACTAGGGGYAADSGVHESDDSTDKAPSGGLRSRLDATSGRLSDESSALGTSMPGRLPSSAKLKSGSRRSTVQSGHSQ